MKKRTLAKVLAGFFVLIGAAFFVVVSSKADNPVVQNIYTADPAPMVSGDTLYLYTGHDEDNLVNNFYTMYDWKCYSTKDMVNFTDHGTVLSLSTFKWAQDRAWAPQCIERNGKFYLYVPIHKKSGGMVIGVAVSDSPTGPFTDAIGKPLVDEGDWNDIDPTVFIDDDGQAYLYFGNPKIRYVKLNEDMLSYDTSIGKKGVVDVEMDEDSFGPKVKSDSTRTSSYAEAPWFYKRNNMYYMVYAGFLPKGGSEHLAYSMSTSPTGPWEYKGIFMPTQGVPSGNNCYTNHPGIVDFKGHSYLFYHNQALQGGSSYHRSVAVEEFTYNEDGTIPTINMTKEGPEAIDVLNPYVWTEAETYAWGTNIEVEGSLPVGLNLCDIKNGSSVKVKNVDFGEKGASSFRAAMASVKGAKMELHLDAVDGPLIGTMNIENTGGDYLFKIFSTDITNATGVHDLFMVFKGEDKVSLAKFDHWRFVAPDDAGDIPDPTAKPIPSPTPVPTPTPTPKPTRVPKPVPTAMATSITTPVPTQDANQDVNIPTQSPSPSPGTEQEKKVVVAKVKGVSVKLVKKTKKAEISWKKVNGAAGYKVIYALDKKFKKGVDKISTKKTKCVSKKLKKGKKYYVKVRAYKKDKAGKTVYGKYSAAKRIKVK